MNTNENEAFRQSKNEATYQSIHEYPQAKNRKQNLYIKLLKPSNTRTPCKPNKYIINKNWNKQKQNVLEKQWSKKLNVTSGISGNHGGPENGWMETYEMEKKKKKDGNMKEVVGGDI